MNDGDRFARAAATAAFANVVVVLCIPLSILIAYFLTPTPGNTVVARVSPLVVWGAARLMEIVGLFLIFTPFAVVAGVRTYFYALRYCAGRSRGWMGVLEGGALGLGLALLILARPALEK